MRPLRNTCAVLGLCLLALGNGAAATGLISVSDGYAALPACAVRPVDAPIRDGELTGPSAKLLCHGTRAVDLFPDRRHMSLQ
jgi:hypothetical protein